MFGFLRDAQDRAYLRGVFKAVEKHGYTAVMVPAGEGPTFGYSVGFQDTLGAPEIIMFGFPMEYLNGLVGLAFQQLKAGDLRLEDKASWEVEGMPAMVWRKVHPSQIQRDYFNVAMINAERVGRGPADVEAFQLFCPDPNLRFPWDAGFDADNEPRQPQLYQPYAGPPGQ